MTKIFKQLGRHWAACLAVVALLIVQAYCDLSLPDYTSKIVDTGIQQGGIESPVPDTVRSTTLQALELLMSEDDAALADEAYTAPDADGVRTLNPDAVTSAITGPIATCVFGLQMNGTPVSSGMGTCGLVGQIGVYTGWMNDIAAGTKAAVTAQDWVGLLLVSFLLPAVLCPLINLAVRRLGWMNDIAAGTNTARKSN